MGISYLCLEKQNHMIKELIMSGEVSNIRLAAQLMKNISEEEFVGILQEIADEVMAEYSVRPDYKTYYKKFNRNRFQVYYPPINSTFNLRINGGYLNFKNYGCYKLRYGALGSIQLLSYEEIISILEVYE